MPSKNTIRDFTKDSMYHVYNRGVDKRIIFTDERDYAVFLSFLKFALLSDEDLSKHTIIDSGLISEATRFNLRRQSLHGSVELIAYCLMPNHYHLLLFQNKPDGITRLIMSVMTAYTIYFNKRHKRLGPLYQGPFKASKINSEDYWDHISRYIHLNPLEIGKNYKTYKYSSYKDYTKSTKTDWLNISLILDNYKNISDYEKFVADYIDQFKEAKDIKEILANY